MKRPIHNDTCLDLTGSATTPFPWQTEKTRLFASGREAMIALLRALALPKGTGILIPAYVPEGIIAPVRRCGFEPVLYPVSRQLAPSWPHVEDLLAQRPIGLAVLIHYFGIAQPVERFHDLCRRHGVPVVEDMAHVMHSESDSLGRTGEFVLYSLPKMLGVPDGAPLVIRKPDFDPERLAFRQDSRHILYLTKQLARLGSSTLYRKLAGSTARRLMRRFVPWRVRNFADAYDTLMAYFENPNPMSAVSRFLLKRTDWRKVIEHRVALARRYHEKLDHGAFERLPGTGSLSHAMFGFPVLVGDREGLVGHLDRHDIRGVYLEDRWDFFPQAGREVHQEAIWTMQHHFLFPTAYSLREEEVDYVIKVANEWGVARSHESRRDADNVMTHAQGSNTRVNRNAEI